MAPRGPRLSPGRASPPPISIDGALAPAPADAERHGRRCGWRDTRHAEVLAVGRSRLGAARRSRARRLSLGLGALRARASSRGDCRCVDPGVGEVRVRRLLAGGRAARRRARPARRRSARSASYRRAPAAPTRSCGRAASSRGLDGRQPRAARTIGRIAEAAAHGARAFVVGGLVRDLCSARRRAGTIWTWWSRGTALAVARALADAVGGVARRARRFLTASVERAATRRRVDVATSRSERYERPGALPRVLPALIARGSPAPRLHGQRDGDRALLRRASACSIRSAAAPTSRDGGSASCTRCRSSRIPTRIFRAARYAARLGLRARSRWSARARRWRSRWRPIPRCRRPADRRRAGADPAPTPSAGPSSLPALARAGAFRLLDPALPAHARRAVDACGAPCRRRSPGHAARAVPAPPLELLATALAADQPAGGRAPRTLRGLGLSGAPLERVRQTLAGGAGLAGSPRPARRSERGARAPRGQRRPSSPGSGSPGDARGPRSGSTGSSARDPRRASGARRRRRHRARRAARAGGRGACWPAARRPARRRKFATGTAKSTTLRHWVQTPEKGGMSWARNSSS